VAAIRQALQYQTYDAAYVETLLLQERRRRELLSPTQVLPQRKELIDDITLNEPDPAVYDRLWADQDLSETPDEGSSPPPA
jgi:hypothetical protein